MPKALRSLLKLPYALALALLRGSSKLFFRAEVWARNSYLTPAFEPVKSDLDLSVYLRAEQQKTGFNRLYRFFKFLFPFLGEVNCYTPATLEYLKKHELNVFELARDPVLLEICHPALPAAAFTKNRALVYLKHTFVSDYHNLKDEKRARVQKWRLHLQGISARLRAAGLISFDLEFDPGSITRSVAKNAVYLAGLSDKDQADLERLNFMLMVEMQANYKNYPFTAGALRQFPYLILLFPEYVAFYDFEAPEIDPARMGLMLDEIDLRILISLRLCLTRKGVEVGTRELELLRELLLKVRKTSFHPRLEPSLEKIAEALTLLRNSGF